MRKLMVLVAALVVPLTLSACQTAQTGSSSFAGNSLIGEPVKKAEKIQPKSFPNEAASMIVKPEDRRAKSKKAPQAAIVNEAASLLVKPVAPKKNTATVSVKKSSSHTTKTTKVASSKRQSSGPSTRKRYRNLIAKHARANGVPLKLAMAVVQVESNYRASARGAAGEIGLMQIMPRTARYIGYKGKMKHLYHPDTNIRYGMKYLGKAYKLGGGSTCGTILKYNAGHGAKKMNPISRKYCNRVRRIMKKG